MRKKIFARKTFLLMLIAAILLFAPAGYGNKKTLENMNLLFITIDTIRADRIGAYGYKKANTPHLDELAKKGIMFENCYSPVPLTLPSHCSIFTGRYPLAHRVRDNGTYYLREHELTLAETMREQGYATHAVIGSYVLLSRFGLNQGFDEYNDSLNVEELLHNFHSEIPADVVYSKFRRWFKNRKAKKFFSWVHFYDPHSPYSPPEKFQNGDRSSDLYDGEVAFTDHYIGRIIQDLKNARILEQTLVVIAGDHGEAFGEHLEHGHSIFCYEENLKVPLIFFNSHLFNQNFIIQNRVNLIDILPTLLKLFNLEVPNEVQGKEFTRLLEGKKESRERSFYIESLYGQENMDWAPLTGLIDGPYKYISLPDAELYDLRSDRTEQWNLFQKEKKIAQAMDEKLKELILESSSSRGNPRRKLTDEDKKTFGKSGVCFLLFEQDNTSS